MQESRINPIVQLSKHYYRRSKHEVKACAPWWTVSFISPNW